MIDDCHIVRGCREEEGRVEERFVAETFVVRLSKRKR